MNCLNYELNQNLNRMYINKNIRSFDVSSSIQVLSLKCVQSHSLQCSECSVIIIIIIIIIIIVVVVIIIIVIIIISIHHYYILLLKT